MLDTTSQTAHTTTPFALPLMVNSGCIIMDNSGETICCTAGLQGKGFETQEDAAANIVKAVNCHEELVEALKALTASKIVSGMNAGLRNEAEKHGAENPLELAKAALAKAGAE